MTPGEVAPRQLQREMLPLRGRAAVVTGVIGVLIFAGIAGIAGGGIWWLQSRNATPSCSWPARIRGTSTAQQDGLVRCYLQALATRSRGELRAVASNIPPARITSGLFLYSPDAKAGVAAVDIERSPVDDTFVNVWLRYADGVTEHTGMMNMIAMGGPSTWRMAIGQPGDLPGQ